MTADVPALKRVHAIIRPNETAANELKAVIADRLGRPGLTPDEQREMRGLLARGDKQ